MWVFEGRGTIDGSSPHGNRGASDAIRCGGPDAPRDSLRMLRKVGGDGSVVRTMNNDEMDEQAGDGGRRDDDDGPRDEDREAILARRKRMIAAALSSLALGAAAADCSPQACLSPRPEDAQSDTGIMAEAQACLSMQLDVPSSDASEGGPVPCLDIAPMDGGRD